MPLWDNWPNGPVGLKRLAQDIPHQAVELVSICESCIIEKGATHVLIDTNHNQFNLKQTRDGWLDATPIEGHRFIQMRVDGTFVFLKDSKRGTYHIGDWENEDCDLYFIVEHEDWTPITVEGGRNMLGPDDLPDS